MCGLTAFVYIRFTVFQNRANQMKMIDQEKPGGVGVFRYSPAERHLRHVRRKSIRLSGRLAPNDLKYLSKCLFCSRTNRTRRLA